MDKCGFLKTAIEVLKYDDGFKKIQKRENLIKLLSRPSVIFCHSKRLSEWEFLISVGRLSKLDVRCHF